MPEHANGMRTKDQRLMLWFKMFAEFSSDAKVQAMSEAMQRRLVMLFCLQCQGELEKLEHDEIAAALRITPDELTETRELFTRKGFLTEKGIPKNWDKRQKYDPTAADRMRRLREREAQHDRNGTVTEAQPGPQQLQPSCALDTELELESEIETKSNTPPNPRKRGKAAEPPPDLPDWVPLKIWQEHRSVRKRKRGAMTPHADGLIIAELEKLRAAGNDPVAVLNASIVGGWTDVWPLKDKTNGKPAAKPAASHPTQPHIPYVPPTPAEQAKIDAEYDERIKKSRIRREEWAKDHPQPAPIPRPAPPAPEPRAVAPKKSQAEVLAQIEADRKQTHG